MVRLAIKRAQADFRLYLEYLLVVMVIVFGSLALSKITDPAVCEHMCHKESQL